MPRGIHKDAEHLHDILEKGVMLDADRVEGSVDLSDPNPVYVGIIVDVEGYGPHVGAMYVDQNRFHGSPDTALQEADEILTEWKLEHYPEHLEDLEKEYGDDALDVFTETFDGWAFKLSPQEFVNAIQGTDAEKFIDVEEPEEEEEEDLEESTDDDDDDDPEREEFPVIRISYTRMTPGEEDEYPEEEHGWIDEEGVEIEPDEDDIEEGMSESESIVEQAIKFLKKSYATDASSSHFHPGVWYSTGYETIDHSTGEEEERAFHLDGFSPEEEAEIFKAITRRR